MNHSWQRLGGSRNSVRKRRLMIINVKPHGLPITNPTARSLWNIRLHHFWLKHKIGTPNCGYILKAQIRIQKEQTLKEIKMRIDSKECLTQMNKNRNVENTIWGQMVKLDSPVKKKTLQEIADRNRQSALHKCLEHNKFCLPLKWPHMSFSRMPLNDSPKMKKTTTNKR